MYDVFLSYSRPDEQAVTRLAIRLRDRRIEVFFDRWSIAAGDLWQEQLERGLEESSSCAVLIGAGGLRAWHDTEMRVALDRRTSDPAFRVIPVLLPGAPRPEELSRVLRQYQWVDLRHDLDDPDALERLVGGLRGLAVSPMSMGSDPLPAGSELKRRLPGRLAATLLGWLSFLRARRFRSRILDHYAEGGLEQAVVGRQFTIPFQERGGAPVTCGTRSVTVVCGPAGVGKTTYASRLAGTRARDLDLVVELRGSRLIASDPQAAIESEILRFFAEVLPLEVVRRLSPSGIVFALTWKRVLILVEDVHHSGDAREALTNLRRFFEQRCRWGPNLRLVATTRESEVRVAEDLGAQVAVVGLEPLAQEQAQEFFFLLCRENEVESRLLVEHGDSIGAAFDTAAIRTPLFVVLCAWLTSPRSGQAVAVGDVLSMSATEIFDTFIQHLFQRASAAPLSYSEFRDVYEDLALELWPFWEDCRELDVQRFLAGRQSGGEALFTSTFLLANGFLFRSWLQGARLAFPHQSMADFLAASAMVRKRDFSKLERWAAPGRVEGLVPFLADLLPDDDTALDRLAGVDFATYLDVIEHRQRVGDRPLPVRSIILRMAAWACLPADDSMTREHWLQVRALLEPQVGFWWVDELCRGIEEAKSVEAHGVDALGALDLPESDRLLARWLLATNRQPKTAAAFERAVDRPGARRFLYAALEDGASEGGNVRRIALRVLSRSEDEETRAGLLDWAVRNVSRMTPESMRALFEAGGDALALLGGAAVDCGEPTRRALSRAAYEATGSILIPAGIYAVTLDERSRKVRLRRPILVPPLNDQLPPGFFKGVRAIDVALRRQLAKHRRGHGKPAVMTLPQAAVALNHFRHSSGQPGVLFGLAKDGPEVLMNGPEDFGLYVVPDGLARAMAPLSASPSVAGTSRFTNVRFRIVEVL